MKLNLAFGKKFCQELSNSKQYDAKPQSYETMTFDLQCQRKILNLNVTVEVIE